MACVPVISMLIKSGTSYKEDNLCLCIAKELSTQVFPINHQHLGIPGRSEDIPVQPQKVTLRTDNNPLTYIFSSACLNAAGHRWVANLADYNFSLEYQRGKDNTVTNFLSRMEDRLPEEEVEEQIAKIPQEGVPAVLDNACILITERGEAAQIRAEAGLDLPPAQACLAETLTACTARMTKLHVTYWK